MKTVKMNFEVARETEASSKYIVTDFRLRDQGEEGVYYVWITENGINIGCNCHLMEKTGIGCSHIFKVLICLGKSMFKGVHERWRVEEQEVMNQKVQALYKSSRGRAKITRRNPIKWFA